MKNRVGIAKRKKLMYTLSKENERESEEIHMAVHTHTHTHTGKFN